MGASFGGEGDAFRSFLRLPRPPMPRRQNTLGRSRKPAASPIGARAEGQARFPGRVPNPGLRTGCQCIHMRVRRAVVRPAHQLLVSTAAARQGMRTGRDARALPKSRDPEKRTPPARGRRHRLPAAARPRLRVRKRIRPMSRTAAATYTQGPTMTADSLSGKPARPRDPDRQAPPTPVRSAQPHAVPRPRPGVTRASVNRQVPAATRASPPSALREVETRRPAFQGRLWLYSPREASLGFRALAALPEGPGSIAAPTR